MNPLNRAFIGAVDTARAKFTDYLRRAKIEKIVYPSKHFFERVVERHIDVDLVFMALPPVIKEFRESTFNDRKFLIQWRDFAFVAQIQLGAVSKKRYILLKTVFDKFNEEDYDVVIRM